MDWPDRQTSESFFDGRLPICRKNILIQEKATSHMFEQRFPGGSGKSDDLADTIGPAGWLIKK